jgi:DNA-binding NarL/FixJ family response regulator
VIAEDLFLLRDGLARLVQAHGHSVAAAVSTGAETLSALLTQRPDVAIVDVRLPPTFSDEGLQASLTARQEVPGLPVLILSQHVEQLYARELLADGNGGIGYLLKDRVLDASQFMDALTRVAGGGTALDPAVVAKLLGKPARVDPLAALTGRERSVLALMAEGLSNTAIGGRLFLSEGSISNYTTTIFAKLGIADDHDTNRRVRAVLTFLGAGGQQLPRCAMLGPCNRHCMSSPAARRPSSSSPPRTMRGAWRTRS